MMEDDLRNMIRKEIREMLAPILLGFIVSNESNMTSTIKRMQSEGPIARTRNIQPFGISSRAPTNTTCLTIPISGDPTHLIMVGHYDSNKPSCNDSETILYDAYGHLIYLSQNKMQFGSKTSANPMMLGDIVQTLFENILDKIAAHRHIGNLGYQTSPPDNATEFEALKASPVQDGSIISSKAFTEK